MSEDADERQARVADLLEDNIRTELHAQNGMADLGLTEKDIERIAHGITAEVLYAFAVDWSPDWVKQGGTHAWQSSGAFFARCSTCLRDSPPSASCEDAVAWAASHEAAHHQTE